MKVNRYEIQPCADLSGANLEEINLEGADLNGTVISIGNRIITLQEVY